MATVKWATPSSRSSSLVTNELDSLSNGSESNVFTHDNSTNLNLYGAVTVVLGSITPSSGGGISLRVTMNDGTDTADKAAGDLYSAEILSGTGSKNVIFPMVRLYPFSLRFSVINNAGVTLSSSANDVYITTYNEDAS